MYDGTWSIDQVGLELALDGALMAISGVLPAAIGANARDMGLICPKMSGPEAAWASADLDILAPRSLTTVRQLARRLGVVPTTFMSRFFRAGIPAPKKYLATARLVRAARLLENPGYSLTQVAFLLEYSSPQSFSRHVTHSLQCGSAEFRNRYSGEALLEHMRQRLILPYQQQLIAFVPVEVTPQWISRPVLMPPSEAAPVVNASA